MGPFSTVEREGHLFIWLKNFKLPTCVDSSNLKTWALHCCALPMTIDHFMRVFGEWKYSFIVILLCKCNCICGTL